MLFNQVVHANEVGVINSEISSEPMQKEGRRSLGPLRRLTDLLGRNTVGAIAILALTGTELEAHLALDGTAQKSTHGMSLPGTGFHEFSHRGALRPLDQ